MNPIWLFPLLTTFAIGMISLLLGRIPIVRSARAAGRSARAIGIVLMAPMLFVLAGSGNLSEAKGIVQFLIVMVALLAPLVAFVLPKEDALHDTLSASSVFTVSEVASRFNLSESTVLELIQSGKLQAKQIGSEFRITGLSACHF